MVCFGVVVRHDGIKVFSRLCGKYLGNIKVGNTKLSAFQHVRFLQEEVARLWPHPTRSCKDLLLYVDHKQLGPPGMPYTTEFSPEELLDVEQALSRIKSTKTIHVMWDESDEHAQRVINETTYLDTFSANAALTLRAAVPNEITYLARNLAKQGITFLNIMRVERLACVQDLQFLRTMKLTGIVLRRVVPTSWADCNVSNLWVENACFDFAFNNLDKVEELSFFDESRLYHYATIFPTFKHYTVDALRGCPNLKKLKIDGYLTRRTAKQLVKTLASMPKLKTFIFEGPAPASLLNDLQAIPSLSSVRVHIYAERLDDKAAIVASAIVASAVIAWLGLVWLDLPWLCLTGDVAWLGLVGLGLAWFGSVWLGWAWLGWLEAMNKL
jgi:hypothetical protein